MIVLVYNFISIHVYNIPQGFSSFLLKPYVKGSVLFAATPIKEDPFL